MTELRKHAEDHGWKRAFRIWNAVLAPRSESFVEKLLQNKTTKDACLDALDATPAGVLVRELLR
jgi:hypothetical protein